MPSKKQESTTETKKDLEESLKKCKRDIIRQREVMQEVLTLLNAVHMLRQPATSGAYRSWLNRMVRVRDRVRNELQ